MSDVFFQKQVKSKTTSLHNHRNAENKVLAKNGKPLSNNERSLFESRFGTNFSNVRIHDDKDAANAAQKIDAQAFTLGNDIVLGNSEVSSAQRKSLIAHELTHVIQQSKANGVQDSSANNETEADNNSHNIAGNGGISVNTSSSTGSNSAQTQKQS